MRSNAEVLVLCGKQCVALRGTDESKDGDGNCGTFLAVLRTIANHDNILNDHLLTIGHASVSK